MITGSNGMLGQRLVKYFKDNKGIELACCSIESKSFIPGVEYSPLDISDHKQVKKIIKDFYPDFIINAAGFTNVDECESSRELAWKVNVTGVENIAKYGLTSDAQVIHISTDYIFDGTQGPYDENSKPNPINYYGRTKLASENVLVSNQVKSAIIRTNVLYGPVEVGKPDFVRWVINSLNQGKEIRIVDDQINNPTYIDDLVIAIKTIVEFKKQGIYNIGGPELLNRLEFTYRISKYFKLNTGLIKQIKTEDLNQPAPRPHKSGLINLKAETELSYKPRSIEESFRLMKRELEL